MVEQQDKLTIVMFSGDLDKAIAGFILATTGASMGMDVTMFFTFWGLNIIKSNRGGGKSRGLLRKIFSFINRGGSQRLPLSKFNFLGLGPRMIGRLMKETRTPSLEEMITMAQEMGVKLVPCSTTCGIMGATEDTFRDGVMSLAGAAYFLNEARQSSVTLFI